MVKPGYKQTEIGVIPEDWIVRRLSECTKRVGVGLATSVTQHYREDGIPIFRNLNIKPGYLDDSDILYLDPDFANRQESKKIRTGDVLTVHTGYVGISCVVPAKYNNALTFTTLITTTDDTLLLPEFLSIYLNSSFGALEIESLQAGGGRNNLNVNDFVNFRIPLPTISEQHKIIEYIKEIERYLELTSQQLAKKKAIKQGAMQELLTGKKRLPGFSNKWGIKTLQELSVEMVDGPFGSDLKTEHYTTNRQVRIIQLSNIGESGWNDANTKYTTFAHAAELSRCVVQPGAVLIAKMMPAGRAIICPDNEKGYILGSDVVKVIPNNSVDSRYLVYATKSQFYLDQIADDTQGSTRARTSVSKLRKTAILFPTKEEQIAIATVLHNMDSEIEALEQKLSKYRQVKQGMMQQLLTGKIRLV